MGTMTYETAIEWMSQNRQELKKAAERGHAGAIRAMRAYWHAREVWTPIHSLDFERRARSFCDALNDFVVEDLNRSGRADLRGRFGYKESDLEVPQWPQELPKKT